MKASCRGCSAAPCARPSTVLTFLPFVCTANIRHERTGAPSTSTVQAPQTPCSQPTCVPVRPQFSRIVSANVLRCSTSTWCTAPFTRSFRGNLSIGELSDIDAQVVRGPLQGAPDDDRSETKPIFAACGRILHRIEALVRSRGGFAERRCRRLSTLEQVFDGG